MQQILLGARPEYPEFAKDFETGYQELLFFLNCGKPAPKNVTFYHILLMDFVAKCDTCRYSEKSASVKST
ncbi:MAG: hypothetical protein C4548_00915 [Desulfobacteraceae bacterium]|nr:MAG: hypothetical protein C4548_00915 [Desulfobacteraceae bacterium]